MKKTNQLALQTECTWFFQQNPFAYETAKGLSVRLGRKTEHLLPILEELVSLSIIEKIGDGEGALFHYNEPVIIGGNGEDATWNSV
ncbi:MAG TPA: hypothetical protein VF199_05585 [Bacillales bacterium]